MNFFAKSCILHRQIPIIARREDRNIWNIMKSPKIDAESKILTLKQSSIKNNFQDIRDRYSISEFRDYILHQEK